MEDIFYIIIWLEKSGLITKKRTFFNNDNTIFQFNFELKKLK